MAQKGAFQDNVDVCSMLHPGPSNMNYWGATACNYATIEYRGKVIIQFLFLSFLFYIYKKIKLK